MTKLRIFFIIIGKKVNLYLKLVLKSAFGGQKMLFSVILHFLCVFFFAKWACKACVKQVDFHITCLKGCWNFDKIQLQYYLLISIRTCWIKCYSSGWCTLILYSNVKKSLFLQVKRHHFMGDGSSVCVAEKLDEAAGVALSALIHALYELNKVIIVRRNYSNASSPKMGCLAPHIKANYEVR